MKHWGLLGAVSMLLCLAARADDCQRSKSPKTELGQYVSTLQTFQNDRRSFLVKARDAQSRYLRLRLYAPPAQNECAWLLNVRDASGRLVQTLQRKDFDAGNYAWTVRVYPPPGNGSERGVVRLDLSGCEGSTPSVKVVSQIEVPESTLIPLYSAKSDLAPDYKLLYASDDTGGLQRGDAVGFFMSSWTNKSPWSCSGVLIAPDLFLTNWHCGAPAAFPDEGFWQDDVRRDALINLSWDRDQVSRDYTVTAVENRDPGLDYAVLRVRTLNALGSPSVARVTFSPAHVGDSLEIIHHPEALPKQISRKCHVFDADYRNWRDPGASTDITHDCDTEAGSSGAPVFNASGEVVAIQHLGYDVCPIAHRFNKAVKVSAILDHLRCTNRPIATEILGSDVIADRDRISPCPH